MAKAPTKNQQVLRNASGAKCASHATNILDADAKALLALTESLAAEHSIDPNSALVLAIEQLIYEKDTLGANIVDALDADEAAYDAEQEASAKSTMRRSGWGRADSTASFGEYEGPATRVTDLDAFAEENPGYQQALDTLDSQGLGGLIHQVDDVYIAEDSDGFDGHGGLKWNEKTQKLELWLTRETLGVSDSFVAFTVRHEMGHVADGAFSTGQMFYARMVTKAHLAEARRLADQYAEATGGAGQLSASMDYATSGETLQQQQEELVAQLFAIATGGKLDLSLYSKPLAALAERIVQDARKNHERNTDLARSVAELDSGESATRRSATTQTGVNGSNLPKDASNGTPSQEHGQVPNLKLPQVIETAARRVAGHTGGVLAGTTTTTFKRVAMHLQPLHDIVDKYAKRVPSMKKWYDAMVASAATRRKYEQMAERINDMAGSMDLTRVNDFLAESTFTRKWGYDPQITGKKVVVDPLLAARFKQLSEKEQAIVKEVFAHGDKMLQAKRDILKSLKLDSSDLFNRLGQIDGPYAPLKRFGGWVAILKSDTLRQAEAANDTKTVEKLKSDPAHYVMRTFDTSGQAKQFAYSNDRTNGGDWGFTDSFIKSSFNEFDRVQTQTLNKLLAASGADNPELPDGVRKAVRQMVEDMYVASIEEHSARTSALKRKNRAGFDEDMMRSFLAHARAEAAFLANMQHGGDISTAFGAMNKESRNSETGKRDAQDAIDIASQHYSDSLSYKETPIQDRVMAFTSAMQLATSVGYHVANLMQNIMVTLPKLASDFNDYSGAWKHMLQGYSKMAQAGIGLKFSLDNVKDEKLRAVLQKAMDGGLLDIGMESDLTHFEGTTTGVGVVDKSSKVVRSAMLKLRQVHRAVEITNRVSSAVAAYELALRHNKSEAQATEYAIRVLETTQGDSSRLGSPLILKKIPKVMTQYKKYQLMMVGLYAKAFMQAFSSSNPLERAIGRRMLAYKMAHTAVGAGLFGLPLMNIAKIFYGLVAGDDEPPDMERDFRKWIGDDDIANLLVHGPMAYLGLDMSAKIGDENVFSLLPYTNVDLTSAKGIRDVVFGLGGPAFSQAGRMADGIGFMAKGEFYKGVEKFTPKGVEDAMKAFRIANEGYTLKNGDLMVKPEDINGASLFLQGLGLPTSNIKRLDWLRNQQYEIKQFFKDRTDAIMEDYVSAHEDGDDKGLSEARDAWMRLQDGKDQLRYLFNDAPKALPRQPLSHLIKAPFTQERRDRLLQASVPVP